MEKRTHKEPRGAPAVSMEQDTPTEEAEKNWSEMEKQDRGPVGAEFQGEVVVSALTLQTGPVERGLMVALALRTVQR